MSRATTLPVDSDPLSQGVVEPPEATVLIVAWSAEQPSHVGEIAVLPEAGRPSVLGRGDEEGGEPRLRFVQQRPGGLTPGPPLAGEGLSRRQLVVVAAKDGGVTVESVGRCELRVNGVPRERAVAAPGDTLYLRRQILLLCARRSPLIPAARYFPRASWRDFGEPDAYGMLGESPAAWLLRERLAFVAKSATHALLVGESGTGKELAARAIHAMSPRASRALVARNAATLPPGLIDAELFGNVKNYPNPGMPERPGLIGEADGGMLFLDEIAELPPEQQAHLLRVLDTGGEYQRLGDAATRRSDFRLIGATNRDPSVLKHDLRARLTSQVVLEPLSARPEDIPLLARHLLLGAAKRSPEVAGRFVKHDSAGRAFARFAPSFVEHLLGSEYPANTRGLEAVLWKAVGESSGSEITFGQQRTSQPVGGRQSDRAQTRESAPEPSRDEIRVALDAAGSVEKAARALGLSSRYALYRLMKKHGIGASE